MPHGRHLRVAFLFSANRNKGTRGQSKPCALYFHGSSKQLAYKGKPLYTFVKDKKPGDKAGDKAMNVWHAVTD